MMFVTLIAARSAARQIYRRGGHRAQGLFTPEEEDETSGLDEEEEDEAAGAE